MSRMKDLEDEERRRVREWQEEFVASAPKITVTPIRPLHVRIRGQYASYGRTEYPKVIRAKAAFNTPVAHVPSFLDSYGLGAPPTKNLAPPYYTVPGRRPLHLHGCQIVSLTLWVRICNKFNHLTSLYKAFRTRRRAKCAFKSAT